MRLSKWLLTPLHRLAEEISNLNPSEKNLNLAGSYHDKEVKVIAIAVDKFLDRLRQFIFREHEFISTASHELRTPIAVISGACDVLNLNKNLSSEIERPLQRIIRSANDMKSMVTALMYLAKEEINPDDASDFCELSSIVKKVIEDHRYLLKDKRIEIILDLENTNLSAPEAIVSIAIANLIRNAFQHTIEGKIEVTLKDARITVEDTGPGMAHSLINGMNQGVQERRNDIKGFGLYIIKKISERFRWSLNFNTSDLGTIAIIDFNKNSK